MIIKRNCCFYETMMNPLEGISKSKLLENTRARARAAKTDTELEVGKRITKCEGGKSFTTL